MDTKLWKTRYNFVKKKYKKTIIMIRTTILLHVLIVIHVSFVNHHYKSF
jgi:hypothetical protein